ncbi:glycosyltransferase family 2 protein [Bacteroides congonensis]|uniref:glycosyltransferase family 2 protein n=1 Tax=Bacteroides congonensis TaxID=1871006 RepID=UPI001899EFDC|nr:glycosyltransferase family 2 protein [Bacteroides congonensis]
MSKVSVIVPVYKIEKYIEKCAVSLFEQTLEDIEFIFVNDGSPDNSIVLLKEVISRYPKRESSVIILNKENGGLASARIHGLQHATGDYIIHCDGDDWVDTNLYESLYRKAIETGAEVVMYPVTEEWGNHSFVRELGDLGDSCQDVLKNWYKNCVQMYTVNKLVKANVYKDNNLLPYEGINMWEDNGLMLRVFYYAKGLAQIDNATYHYFRGNEQALTHNYGRKAVDQMIKCAGYLYNFYEEKTDFKEYEKTALAIKFFARINLITTTFGGLREYYQLFPESDAVIPFISDNAFSSKGIIRFKFVKYNLAWLFVLLFKVSLWVKK